MKTQIIIEIETEGYSPTYPLLDYEEKYDEDGEPTNLDWSKPFTEQQFHDRIHNFIQNKFGQGYLVEELTDVMPEEWDSIEKFAEKISVKINGVELKEID